jgi:hypothetical protein
MTKRPLVANRPWTSGEEAQLRAMAQIKPAAVIARQLGRTEEAVRHRAFKLGISLERRLAKRLG